MSSSKGYYKAYYATHSKRIKELVRQNNYKLKLEVFSKYGNKCECCKETTEKFLTIDHIKGGGSAHLRKEKLGNGGYSFYLWLRRNNYPPGFRVLCWNCNCSRRYNKGRCPGAPY